MKSNVFFHKTRHIIWSLKIIEKLFFQKSVFRTNYLKCWVFDTEVYKTFKYDRRKVFVLHLKKLMKEKV